jgi:hypothetical protein
MSARTKYLPSSHRSRLHYLTLQLWLWSWWSIFVLALWVAVRPLGGIAQQPVELRMHDGSQIVRFSIPKAYLHFSGEQKEGVTDGFSMYVIYPAMLPLSRTSKSTADRDVLSIYLFSHFRTGAHWTPGQFIDDMVAHYWTRVERIGNEFDGYVRNRDLSRWNDKSSLAEEYLVPTNRQPDREVYFSCYRELGNPAVGCSGIATFANEIEMRWIFRRSRLEEWPEMLSKVESFLKSLVKN